MRVEQLPAVSGIHHFKCTERVCNLQARQPSFFNIARAFSDVGNCNVMIPGTGHACRYGGSSFYGRWYGANVHVIHFDY